MQYQPHNILITGGAGFIGANFIRYLFTQEPSVNIINIDKLTYAASLDPLSYLSNEKRYHFYQGDIADEKLIQQLLSLHDIDTIIHLAAESHVDRSINAPAAFVQTNFFGTYVLLEAARQFWLETKKYSWEQCRFHHISTDEVYGSLTKDAQPFTEVTAYQPRSPYSATKAGSDHLVSAYCHTYGLPITISHCSNNYGPYQHQEKFIPTIILSCLKWQPIPIYGHGKNIRDWLYVEDHCKGILNIIHHGKIGESYNMGANNEWENLALAKYICQQMNVLHPHNQSYTNLLQFVTDRKGHDFRYAIDSNKIHAELNWRANETFESGINKTIMFYIT